MSSESNAMRNARHLLKKIVAAIYTRFLPTQVEQPLKDHTGLTCFQKRLNLESDSKDIQPYKLNSPEILRFTHAIRESLIASHLRSISHMRFNLDEIRKNVASDIERLKIDKKRIVQTFIHQAQNSPDGKNDAINVLGLVGDTSAIGPLLQLLKEQSNPNVLSETAIALDDLNWNPNDEVEKACYAVAMEDWDRAVMLGETAVEPLVRILSFDFIGEDHDMRVTKAGESLVQIGKPAVEQLSLILNVNKHIQLESNVKYVLKEIGD